MNEEAETPGMIVIGSGSEMLDEDLSELLAVGRDQDRAAEIKSLARSQNIRPADIIEMISISALRLANLMRSNEHFEELKANFPEVDIKLFEEAKAYSDDVLGELLRAVSLKELERAAGESSVPLFSLNTPDQVRHASEWAVASAFVRPSVRVSLVNRDQEREIVSMSLDWDDLAFLSNALLNILSSDVEIASEIVKSKRYAAEEILVHPGLGTKIRNLKENLERLEVAMETLAKGEST